MLAVSDPFADLFPRRREREREHDRAPRDAFVGHARQVLLARWGTSLTRRAADLPGAQVEFPLVSGNGRIVGEVPWLVGMESPEWKSATLSEHVWVMSHVAAADRRFLLVGHDIDLVTRWVARRRGMLDGVEVWSLDGDELERLA
ncbi:MAG TPA: hypothetical protein VF244_05330 [Acidimicrobiales bacterium]